MSGHVGQRLGIRIDRDEVVIFRWDEQALSMVTAIEDVTIPLNLDSQGQFIISALNNLNNRVRVTAHRTR
jgi:hypothetical protein